MRITKKLLKSANRGKINYEQKVLILSKYNLVLIENLQKFSYLKYLDLSDNNLEFVENLEFCYELWHLNLSNNKLRQLDGLSRFVALGSLILSNNDLDWPALRNIRHIYIIHLSLHGNAKLQSNHENKTHYRTLLIDIFPRIWCLDGCFITSAERLEVQHYFQDSALSNKPLRRKFPTISHFTPSDLKTVRVNGTHGSEAARMLTTFPDNGPENFATDIHRLEFFAQTVQKMVSLVEPDNVLNRILKTNEAFLEQVLIYRKEGDYQLDRSNMLLLLLLCSLEFALPTQIIKETLEICQIAQIGEIETLDIFLLPKHIRCWLCQVLYAATKIDVDNRESGIYSKLFEAFFLSMNELTHVLHSKDADSAVKHRNKFDRQGMKSYRSMLAAELIYQFCLVPSFYDWLSDLSIMYLIVLASGQVELPDKIILLLRKETEGKEIIGSLYESLSGYLCRSVNLHVSELCSHDNIFPGIPNSVARSCRALPRRPLPRSLFAAGFLSAGRTPPARRPVTVCTARGSHGNREERPLGVQKLDKPPCLGDEVCLGPQSSGRIMSIPEPSLALVQLNSVTGLDGGMTASSGDSNENFVYVDIHHLRWSPDFNHWRPTGASGDRVTIGRDSAGSGSSLPVSVSRPGTVRSGRPISAAAAAAGGPRPLSAVISRRGDAHFMHPMELAEKLQIEDDDKFLKQYQRSLAELRRSDAAADRDGDREDVFDSYNSTQAVKLPFKTNRDADEEQDKEFLQDELEEPVNPRMIAESPAPASSPRGDLSEEEAPSDEDRQEAPLQEQLEQESLEQESPQQLPEQPMISHQQKQQQQQQRQFRQKYATTKFSAKPFYVHQMSNGQKIMQVSPRPLSAVEIYRFVLAREESPRPQRPRRTVMSARPAARPSGHHDLQQADKWLAGGRDLWTEQQFVRPNTRHRPGWMDGSTNYQQKQVFTVRRSPRLQYCYCRQNYTPGTIRLDSEDEHHSNILRPPSAPTYTTRGVVCQRCHNDRYSKIYS